MRFILDSARKDLRRRLADPMSLLPWIGIPILLGGLLAMLSSNGATPVAHLLVVDQDDTGLTRLLTGTAVQNALGGFLQMQQVSLSQGRERMDAGEASALLIIPEGFSHAVLEQQPTELTLITNPAQQILPKIIQQGLEMLVQGTFYVQRLFGPELRTIRRMNEQGQDAAGRQQVQELSSSIYDRIDQLGPLLFPPVLRLRAEESAPQEHDAASADFDPLRLFLPGMLFMSVLFVAEGMSDDLWQEASQGTLHRFLSTPRRVEHMLAGKLLAGLAVIVAVATVALLVAWWRLSVSPARLPIALLWCSFSGVALLAYFLTLQSLATNRRGGHLLATLVLFPLMFLGGSFFPFAAMPDWMAAVGQLTPNGAALAQFQTILFATPTAAGLARPAVAIALPAVVALYLCARRLRTGPMARS